MYCSNCGNKIENGGFCSNCGAKVDEEQNVQTMNQQMVNNQYAQQPMNQQMMNNQYVQQPMNQQMMNNQYAQQPMNQQMMNNQYVQQPMNQQGVGSLTITRPSNLYGALVPFDVFVDGYLVGTLANGETKTFPLYYGNHYVQVKQTFGGGSQNIVINDSQRNLVFKALIDFGFVSNPIHLVFVSFYN